MKKAFTLLELVVVIIILGVLATLGFTQYGRMVERARGAEARVILGDIRKLAFAQWLENGTLAVTNSSLNIGTAADQIPVACTSTHYFSYDTTQYVNNPVIIIYATRCTSGGKTPQGITAGTLTLTSNLTTGVDTWGGDGGY